MAVKKPAGIDFTKVAFQMYERKNIANALTDEISIYKNGSVAFGDNVFKDMLKEPKRVTVGYIENGGRHLMTLVKDDQNEGAFAVSKSRGKPTVGLAKVLKEIGLHIPQIDQHVPDTERVKPQAYTTPDGKDAIGFDITELIEKTKAYVPTAEEIKAYEDAKAKGKTDKTVTEEEAGDEPPTSSETTEQPSEQVEQPVS